MKRPPTTSCPLCHCLEGTRFSRDKIREYLQCSRCRLVYVPEHQHLSEPDEKSRYDLHENEPDNPGYRAFLERLRGAMAPRLQPSSRGLDFGSGPVPVLSQMFEELGHSMVIYDHFYAKDLSVFEQTYDFIAASEVVEHLHRPSAELDRLWGCLKPGGLLGIMTRLLTERVGFENWHYKRDDTHVCFYTKETFEWLGAKWLSSPTIIDEGIVLFVKSDDGSTSAAPSTG